MRHKILALSILWATLGCPGSDSTANKNTGMIVVTAVTTGADLDANGYQILVDGSDPHALASNGGSDSLADLGAGDHNVLIEDLAANCTLSTAATQTVTLTAGRTAPVTFRVNCVAFGAVHVSVTTVGADLDPDGFSADVDFQPAQPLPINGAVDFPQVAPGTPMVTLGGVGGNCTVSPSRQVSVTVASSSTAQVAFSVMCFQAMPAGSAIAFARNEDVYDELHGDIELLRDGGVPINLAHDPRRVGAPVWSPDATKIAFVSNRDGNSEIYVMNSDGSARRNLTNNSATDYSPAWSPDGTQIAFVSNRDGNSEIYVMAGDGSGQTRLTNNAANDVNPTWSPDGATITFLTDRDGNLEIYEMNADGSQAVDRSNSAGADRSPVWSPDGRRIAFVTDRDGNDEIYVMNADGSAQVNVTNSPSTADESPAWSPDGTRIAFVRGGIFVMNADGTGATPLVLNHSTSCATAASCGSSAYSAPSWSPDGSTIAFQFGATRSVRDCELGCYTRLVSTSSGISVMHPDGSARFALVSDPVAGDGAPVWRPR